MARCFVAVKLGKEIDAGLKEVQDKARALELDATFPKEFHATLAFLGELSEKQIGETKQKLDSLKTKPACANVKGVGFFPSEKFVKVFWTGVGGMEGLQKQIASALGYQERFEGHITLARVKTQKNRSRLKQLAKDYEAKEFGKAEVKEVFLMKSNLSPLGPHYEELFVKKLS